MSGGLSDMNKDLSGIYNHSKSTESSVLPQMKENIIEDMTDFKVSNKHSDFENNATVIKDDGLKVLSVKLNDVNKIDDTLVNESYSSAFMRNESNFLNSEPFILGDQKDEISRSSNISKKTFSQIENHESRPKLRDDKLLEVISDDLNNTNTKFSKPEFERNSVIVLEGDVQKVTGDDSIDMNSSDIDTDSSFNEAITNHEQR